MRPKISVIIPMYNVDKYLRTCLDSVLNQTFTDWQAICVDDGSPDKSGEIAEEYAARDKRFIVVHKKNGGLSDARNFGMRYAKGKYIMYLDSDDFIHPQMMEFAYHFAERDNSGIVAFSYDRYYRPLLKIRHLLHLDMDSVVPHTIKKHYNIQKTKTLVTDNIFEYATEYTHNAFNKNRHWLIKHCQVWKNLYRRDLIADIPFIQGILFEDFPWWSEVLLKNPKTTIVNLPMYFYRPNFGGILLSAKQLKIMESLCIGIESAYLKYKSCATEYQMKKWTENFLWCFINWAFRKVRYLKTEQEIQFGRRLFKQLRNSGVFDDVPNEWYDLRESIYVFIGE